MDKTHMIKDRVVYVYLSSLGMVGGWQQQENLGNELKHYWAKQFLQEVFRDVGRFNRNPTELRSTPTCGRAVPMQLNINPLNMDLVRAVYGQIEALEAYGLVEYKDRVGYGLAKLKTLQKSLVLNLGV